MWRRLGIRTTKPRRVVHLRRRLVAGVESLESRTLLTQLTVNSLSDDTTAGDGLVTLREAIVAANADAATDLGQRGRGADEIVFAPELAGGTIRTAGQIQIFSDLTIIGLGAAALTIDETRGRGLFLIETPPVLNAPDFEVRISGLTITSSAEGPIEQNGFTSIFNRGQDVTLADCVFTGNRYTIGVLFSSRGNVTVAGCTFDGNEGRQVGVMDLDVMESVTIRGSRFLNNVGVFAGAVDVDGPTTVANSLFRGNRSEVSGGAIDGRSSLFVTGSTFVDNVAVLADGGAIYHTRGNGDSEKSISVVNSTFSGNTAGDSGGAIYHFGSLDLRNNTIFGNRANTDDDNQGAGGGVFDEGPVSTEFTVLLANNIIAGNTRGTAGVADDLRSRRSLVPQSRNNLIGDAATAAGLTNGVNGNIVGVDAASVIDVMLRNNGGPTPTHALLPTSAARNAGDNASAVGPDGEPLTVDQRGGLFRRIAEGTVDIGAIEFQDLPPTAVDDRATTLLGRPVTIDVLINDGFRPGTALTAIDGQAVAAGQTVTLAASGSTVRLNADGTLTYIPGSGLGPFPPGGAVDESFTYQLTNATDGDATATVRVRVRESNRRLTAYGVSDGGSTVQVDDADGETLFRFEAFPGQTTGARVAVGDVNGDGTPDIIVGSGASSTPLVKVFSGVDGSLLRTIDLFRATLSGAFAGGTFVAAGNLVGSAAAEIVVAADAGDQPRVVAFSLADGTLRQVVNFSAFGEGFRGGVRVAVGDVNGDGGEDVIVGSGVGSRADVRVYDGRELINHYTLSPATLSDAVPRRLLSLRPFDDRFTGGVFVAAGQVIGDYRAEVIVSQDFSPAAQPGDSKVIAFNRFGTQVANFFAYGDRYRGGVRVAVGDTDGNGVNEILTSAGIAPNPDVRAFAQTGTRVRNGVPLDPSYRGGLHIASGFTRPPASLALAFAGDFGDALPTQ